jgi:hypothetical protein
MPEASAPLPARLRRRVGMRRSSGNRHVKQAMPIFPARARAARGHRAYGRRSRYLPRQIGGTQIIEKFGGRIDACD